MNRDISRFNVDNAALKIFFDVYISLTDILKPRLLYL